MKFGIIGKKVGMTHIYEGNVLTPVTVVDTTGCVIAQVKTQATDGYSAVQLAFGDIKPQNVKKPIAGHYKKANVAARRNLVEIRVDSDEQIKDLKPGTELSLSKLFEKGDLVDVTSKSKGKGFQGVMKRHNMAGAKASHGVHEAYRHGGSIGQATDPGRVKKNMKMPGQMGNVRKTIQTLKIVDIRDQDGALLIKGGIPGGKNGIVLVRPAAKKPAPAERTWA